MKTLFELAEDFIWHQVKRGDTLAFIRKGYGGLYSGDLKIQIGGYFQGKKIPDKIAVERGGEAGIFSLKKVYDSVKQKLTQRSLL